MLVITQKLLKFCLLVMAGIIFPLQVYAQNIGEMLGEMAESYDDFVENRNVQYLSGQNMEDEIFCGKKNGPKCNRKTQICLRCSFYKSGGIVAVGSRIKTDEGKCVPKPSKDPAKMSLDELHALAGGFCFTEINTEDSSLVGRVKGFLAGNTKLHLSYEKNGFIASNEARLGLFINIHFNKDEFCENNGNSKKCYMLIYDTDNSASLAYSSGGEEGKNITKGCEVLPIKIYNMKNCFFCPLTKVVFGTANDVTQLSFESFSDAFKNLILIAFAVWLAFTSLKIVFTHTKQDGNKYLSGIIVQSGKFLLAYLLLSYPDDLFRLFISPVLQAGIDMANAVKAVSVDNGYVTSGLEGSANEGYFNADDLYEKIEAFIADVQAQLAAMQAIGSSLFCVGGHQMMIQLSEVRKIRETISSGIQMMALGFILFVFALLLTITFAFYFIDALLQIAILGAMLPMMIAGWPFKTTSSYAMSGFKMLLNTFFTLFFVGFVVAVEIYLINAAMNQMKDGGLLELFNAINDQNGDKIRDLTSVGGAGFLLIIFASLFGFKFVKDTPKVASSLADGLNLGVASKVATVGASSAKGAAKKVSQPFTNMAKEKYHEKGGLMGATGRLLQLPAKFKESKAGQALGNTVLGKAIANAKKPFKNFGNKIGEKITAFGDKKYSAGVANTQGNKIIGAIRGMGQKFVGKMAQRFGGGISHVSQDGLLNATGQRLEKFAVKIHKEYSDAEKRAKEHERRVEAFKKKHGRDPKKGEV